MVELKKKKCLQQVSQLYQPASKLHNEGGPWWRLLPRTWVLHGTHIRTRCHPSPQPRGDHPCPTSHPHWRSRCHHRQPQHWHPQKLVVSVVFYSCFVLLFHSHFSCWNSCCLCRAGQDCAHADRISTYTWYVRYNTIQYRLSLHRELSLSSGSSFM